MRTWQRLWNATSRSKGLPTNKEWSSSLVKELQNSILNITGTRNNPQEHGRECLGMGCFLIIMFEWFPSVMGATIDQWKCSIAPFIRHFRTINRQQSPLTRSQFLNSFDAFTFCASEGCRRNTIYCSLWKMNVALWLWDRRSDGQKDKTGLI